MSNLAPALPDDPALLKALIAALQAENTKISATLRAHDQLIQTLRLRIARLKEPVFGQSSEKIGCEIGQLEPAPEDPRIASTESGTAVPDGAPEAAGYEPAGETADRPSRRRPRVSDGTPRERRKAAASAWWKCQPISLSPDSTATFPCIASTRSSPAWVRISRAASWSVGAVYAFAPDWKAEHVHRHLADTRGILQAPSHGPHANHCRAMDGYKGQAKLHDPDPGEAHRLREAACRPPPAPRLPR